MGEAMAGQKTDTLTVEYKVYTLHNITCKCMLSSLRTLTLTSKQKMEPMGLCMARYYAVTDGSQAVVRSEAYSLLAWTEGCTYG